MRPRKRQHLLSSFSPPSPSTKTQKKANPTLKHHALPIPPLFPVNPYPAFLIRKKKREEPTRRKNTPSPLLPHMHPPPTTSPSPSNPPTILPSFHHPASLSPCQPTTTPSKLPNTVSIAQQSAPQYSHLAHLKSYPTSACVHPLSSSPTAFPTERKEEKRARLLPHMLNW